MNNSENLQNTHDETVDIKRIIFKYLYNWYWFVLALLLAFAAAYLYNRYTPPIYEISSTILVEEEKTSSSFTGGTGNVFQGLGIMNSMRNINNQIAILKSTPIITRTLQELDFEVSYYAVGRIIASEQYKDVPFQVIWQHDHPQIIDADFELNISSDGQLHLKMAEQDATVYSYQENEKIKQINNFSFSKDIEPGVKIVSDNFSFTILLNEHFNPKSANNYKFKFNSTGSLIKKYREKLEVSLLNKDASILVLKIRDYNVGKGVDFLNKLTEVFQFDNLLKKNENANRTIQFISSQLQNISDSLSISETRMESFQSEHQLLDISIQSQQLLEQMKELDKERVALETQNKYYHYLRDYIQKGTGQETETVIAPSAMGIQDPLLNSLILQLNELITEKSGQTSIRQSSQHPTIVRLNAQTESVKRSLRENVENIISQSDMALDNLNKRIRGFEAQVRRLPATERNFVNIERKYKLNNETYTFLLQKLSEAQIAKASNVSDSQVIEEAQIAGTGPVEPKKMIIYVAALLIGLAFPVGIIFLKDFFNTKVNSQEDIENITNIPIIGHVFLNQNEFSSHTLVLDKPNSPASEPFRAIRTKLNLITKGKRNPIIAITSTFPKEGKSYNAVNIASAIALANKSVVLLDLDLRNSALANQFALNSDIGLVNYIIGEATPDEIVFQTKHPRLHLIPAGPIPPNPAEMLTSDKLLKLIEILKEKYDVVILDTPPVAYVADMYQLRDLIDANTFIGRHKFSH